MNLLQGIPGPVNYVVTLNPTRPVPREKVLYETTYTHPLYTAASVDTHALLPRMQNRSGLAWAGAWCGYGFHEDGLVSALRAVQALDPACVPAWSKMGSGPISLGSVEGQEVPAKMDLTPFSSVQET
jgi:predicted NAD/FAD-binding protein